MLIMKTAKEALATHLGMNYADLSEYNYQYGHWSKSIYAIGDNYFCCVKEGQKPATPTRKGVANKEWTELKDEYVNKYGWKLFISE